MQEKSDLNGQTYTVQYFERAVFEKHPENQPPFDVLLSQLGTFRYRGKYGAAGAPGQQANPNNARVFPETGHSVGGVFRSYWEAHGGLAQQGLPISDEFTEVSDLNGKSYTVQYFERAVFELHPENQPPFNVLLSQLGTFQYKQKYGGGSPPTPTPGAALPSPTATPVAAACDQDVPAAQAATITPRCGPLGTLFRLQLSGFQSNETISFWITTPDGRVAGTAHPLNLGNHGPTFDDAFDSSILADFPGNPLGIWALTYQGTTSKHQSIAWFKIVPQSAVPTAVAGDCSGVPASQHLVVTPACGPTGTTFQFTASGFKAGEKVGIYVTKPTGVVDGAPFQASADANGVVGGIVLRTNADSALGIWAITMEGVTTHAKAIGYFKVTQ